MRILLVALFILFSSGVYAQTQPIACVDSSRIEDKTFNCGGFQYTFDPVCGCDNITYRNICTAEHWGRLTSWTTNSICANFYMDFYPTAVSNFPGTFSIYLKTISPVTLYIYDAYGRIKFTEYYNTIFCSNSPNPNILCREIPVQNLDMGVYILIAVVNGEHQSIKFAKINKFQ